MTITNLIAIGICGGIGAGRKPLADPVAEKLLTTRGKEFKADRRNHYLQIILSAALGAAIGYKAGISLYSLFLLALLFCGNVISTTDIQYRLIPNDMVVALLGIKLGF